MTDAAPLRPQNVSAALPDPAEFGAMLCSRICHDLISPVGAIGNGVELLQELDRGASEGAELQLIGHSAQMASASLQFLRIAFEVQDGEIKTACAQSCPARAIVFGDLEDPDSRVTRLSRSERASQLLEDMGTHPSVFYLRGGE